MPDAELSVGDPAAMRALAAELLGRAELIGPAGAPVTASLDDATFEGRAADRLRGSVIEVRAQVSDAASRLREVATRLLADASSVERQNAALRAAAEAQAAKVKADAIKAAGGNAVPGAATTPGAATPDPATPGPSPSESQPVGTVAPVARASEDEPA